LLSFLHQPAKHQQKYQKGLKEGNGLRGEKLSQIPLNKGELGGKEPRKLLKNQTKFTKYHSFLGSLFSKRCTNFTSNITTILPE